MDTALVPDEVWFELVSLLLHCTFSCSCILTLCWYQKVKTICLCVHTPISAFCFSHFSLNDKAFFGMRNSNYFISRCSSTNTLDMSMLKTVFGSTHVVPDDRTEVWCISEMTYWNNPSADKSKITLMGKSLKPPAVSLLTRIKAYIKTNKKNHKLPISSTHTTYMKISYKDTTVALNHLAFRHKGPNTTSCLGGEVLLPCLFLNIPVAFRTTYTYLF